MSKANSFRHYLEQNKENAARTLVNKAYLANKIAKISVGEQREKMYQLKNRYLTTASRLMPEMFLVDSRIVLRGKNELLGLTTKVGYRFHVVIKENTEETRTKFGKGSGNTELAA